MVRRSLLLLGLPLACIRTQGYPCQNDAECDLASDGVCVAEAGYCSYPDLECDSGLRFESRAPSPLANACVQQQPPTDSTSSSEGTGGSGDTNAESSESSDDQGGSTGSPCGTPNAACCEPTECDANLLCFGDACGCAIELVVGDTHTCAIRLDNRFECWGANVNQELGRDDPGQVFTEPGPVVGLPQPAVVTSAQARYHTCVVALGGDVYCWGDNTLGQSNPDVEASSIATATRVATADDLGWQPELVGVGQGHTCLAGEGHLLCWGDNEGGQLGWPTDKPAEVDTDGMLGEIVEVAAGGVHTCVRTGGDDPNDPSLQRIYCWGFDGVGSLGNGDGINNSTTPTEVVLDAELAIASLSASDLHTCAVAYDPETPTLRHVYCWGQGESGAASGMAGADIHTPSRVQGLPSREWASVSAGPSHTCSVADDEGVWCWGNNAFGPVTPTEVDAIVPPTRVPTESERGVFLYSVGAGLVHSCGIGTDAAVTCWGCGALGQLGDEWLLCDQEQGGWGSVRSACQ